MRRRGDVGEQLRWCAVATLGLLGATPLLLGLGACVPRIADGRLGCDPEAPGSCPAGWVCQQRGTTGEHRCYQEGSSRYCGNGVLDPGEACDGSALPGIGCDDLGFFAGGLACDDRCRLRTDGCLRVTALSAHAGVTAAVDDQGGLWTWGANPGLRQYLMLGYYSEVPAREPVSSAFRAVAAGYDHACALDEAGMVWCWGDGIYGQLGRGPQVLQEVVPTPVTREETFVSVFAGVYTSCVLDAQGHASCWGLNNAGQLGLGDSAREAYVFTPTPVAGDHRFATLALGALHACGLDRDGVAWCWGWGMKGACGDPACDVSPCGEPVPVLDAPRLVQLVAGDTFTCGLTDAGLVACWGRNTHGELGDDASEGSPVPVAPAGVQVFDELSAGPHHVCARDPAGDTWCWGALDLTDLGARRPPRRLDLQGTRLHGLASGLSHLCGLDAQGRPHCLGVNGVGQLGRPADSTRPGRVAAGPLERLALAHFHACGLDAQGEAWCWGSNVQLTLGQAVLADAVLGSPRPLRVDASTPFVDLVGGAQFGCGLDPEGGAWCWGVSSFGVLGDQGLAERPRAIPASSAFTALSAGWDFVCGLAGDGEAWCWGMNLYGALGTGDTIDRSAPTRVEGGHVFQQIVTGSESACGLDLEGQAWCWGDNAYGQLGDGTVQPALVPVPVAGSLELTWLSLSGNFACGLDPQGTAHCWGLNQFGQLGVGQAVLSLSTPTPVQHAQAFSSISAGANHACGLEPGGRAVCWGINLLGALGIEPRRRSHDLPTPVETPLRFAQLRAGWDVTCGLEADGQAWCWGADDRGQLGTAVQSFTLEPVTAPAFLGDTP